jgi:hypothetical protein
MRPLQGGITLGTDPHMSCDLVASVLEGQWARILGKKNDMQMVRGVEETCALMREVPNTLYNDDLRRGATPRTYMNSRASQWRMKVAQRGVNRVNLKFTNLSTNYKPG